MSTPAGAGGDAESSDDDIEIVPESVDNYWLEHGDETPVSFASLPYFKTGQENLPDKSVYVRGTQDNGMRLYLKSVAWKLEFSNDIKPVFHLKTEKYWIQLKKPRKSFETTIRSIMSTAMFLNYALMNPRDPEKVAWSHVRTVFKSWDVAPSRDDLSSHLLVIQHLIELNERLASSSALQTIPTGVPRKRLASAREVAQQSHELYHRKYEEVHLGDEKEINDLGDDLNVDEVGNLEETVCCICDDGGDMICCDGPCMRSFHLKGSSSSCNTLGLSKADADRMDKFFCPNCKFKRHQCYVCGELGCSDDAAGAGQEVFVCNVATCGHFYHPSCVADLVLRDKDASEQVAMAESIKEGKVFVCPMHNCLKCGQVEVKEDTILQFGVCRRCPKVWHRQCLPSSLLNTDPKRCWYGLLPKQILVYCKRHTIIPELATPARDHVKFPEGSIASAHKRLVRRKVEGEAKNSKPSKLGSFEKKDMTGLKSPGGHLTAKLSAKQQKPFSPLRQTKPKGREPRKSKVDQGGAAPHCSMAKARDRLPAANPVKGSGTVEPSQDNEQKCNSPGKGRSDLHAQLARTSVVAMKSPTLRKLASHPLPQRNKALVYKASSVDKDTKSMVDGIIDRAKASVTVESVLKKHEVPASSTEYSNDQDRKYSLVKLESLIEGMRKAVETLENGGSIEDAKLQCSPDYINYIESCRKDLKFYLAPLVHAYSRHFMKPEKLKEIVDHLHWYLKEGDMVVDFACGSNDFSLLMKKKLEESGKACEYRNFDLIQTNNDFNFSKRDWFEVKPSELPDGDRLIIGLNPPFGSKGHRANQYIDHALTFRPKLIVLMISKETQRLDQKDDTYDLVWEDSNLLGGCLPGSVDVDDNNPSLYVWSRPDWTLIYKQIALDQGHIFPISSSSFLRSPCKASSPRPLSHSDFGKEKNRNDKASVELGIKEEIGDFKYCNSVTVNEPIGGREAIGDLDKKSVTRHVEHMFVNEPIGGQGTVSNADASNASKLDQNMRIRELLELDGPMFDTQVNDNSPKSYKMKTTTKYSHNDGFVPLKRHTNLKRKGVDSETLSSQLNEHNSQETPEKARNSSSYEPGHDVSKKKRKANDEYICGDDKRNDELTDDNHQSSEKCLPADLGGIKSPERRKLPDKYGMSRQGEDRKASPERSPHCCMANEQRVGSPDKVSATSVVNLGKVSVANNARNDDYMNPELPKPVSRHDNLPRYEFLNRNFHGRREALSAQRAQWQDPFIGCNVQMPVSYNGAVFATHNTPSGLYSLYPPTIGMQDMNRTSNRSGTGHSFGASGTGRAHFLPEFQRSQQYFGPSIIIPSHPAPFYAGPAYPPPPDGCFQPKHSDPLALQRVFLPNNQPQYHPIQPQYHPIQPHYPPIQETLPNQKNTGGWFDD